jgi:predicted dehydrogenase
MLLLKELAKEGVSGGFGSVVWSRDEAYYRSGDWRGKWETEGGGVLINQALHTLDLLQWVCGMPETVTAHIFNDHLKGKIEVEDTASVLFSLKNGAHLHFFATTAASVDFPVQLQLVLKDGTVLLAQNNILARNGQVVTSNDIKGVTIGKQVWGNGHQRLISDFYHCLSEGKAFPIGFQEAQCVIRLILAIYQSNGHPIDVSDSPTKV